ncbi:MAG TPA: hypothetical protein VFZ08_14345 [Terriglobia bacterium]|nr:hypothetical protein [Terriglobia bacterium]
MSLRLKPVARSLSAHASFFGLELEDWGLVLAWGIVMRLIGDRIHRVLMGFVPVSALLAYGSSLMFIVVIRWATRGRPRGYLISWVRHHLRAKAHVARTAEAEPLYLGDERP